MAQEPSRALVPVSNSTPPEATVRHAAAKLGSRALALWGRSPAIRKAALAGAAFGLGYQLSRMARSGTLPRLASDARDFYKLASGEEPEAEGRMASGWVRESVTIISAVYGFLDRDDVA